MVRPLAIDLFSGLGGWSSGLIAEGWDCIGFDIERHEYGDEKYPGQLVIQDVLTLHGSQFRSANLIVASPPCQEFSYMAMPWYLAKEKRLKIKADPAEQKRLTALFDTCFRIQREACEAAGHHIPMIVENVRGAQEWVGRARWNFGSFYIWGDVPALMPPINKRVVLKHGIAHRSNGATNFHGHNDGQKVPSLPGRRTAPGNGARFTSRDCGLEAAGLKSGGDWFNAEQPSISRLTSSGSLARKAASALIAKIPEPLSRHIARVYRPTGEVHG